MINSSLKIAFVLTLSVVVNYTQGQFNYINLGVEPPFPNIGSGYTTELLVRGEHLISYNISPSAIGGCRFINSFQPSGNIVQTEQYLMPWPIEKIQTTDAIRPLSGGYILAGSYDDVVPGIFFMDSLFDKTQEIAFPEYLTDSTYGRFYSTGILSDQSIVSAGNIVYNWTDGTPGYQEVNLLIARHNQYGELIWIKEFNEEDFNFSFDISGFQAASRSGVFELSTGEILVPCSIGMPFLNYALKFDVDGNFIDYVRWGNGLTGFGKASVCPIGNDQFAFAYMRPVSEIGDVDNIEPHVGILDATNLAVELNQSIYMMLDFGRLTDFEATPDGHFLILGYGVAEFNDPPSAFMIKVDQEGNEIWRQHYTPTVEYSECEALDLEMTPDGGFAFVGDFRPMDPGDLFYTWLVKTDECGDVVYNGCPGVVNVEQLSNTPSFEVYPNPTTGHLNLSWPNQFGISDIRIYNSTGQLMLQKDISPEAAQETLSVEHLSPGIYFIQFMNKDGILESRAFVKE